jgi:hypothetical protein
MPYGPRSQNQLPSNSAGNNAKNSSTPYQSRILWIFDSCTISNKLCCDMNQGGSEDDGLEKLLAYDGCIHLFKKWLLTEIRVQTRRKKP